MFFGPVLTLQRKEICELSLFLDSDALRLHLTVAPAVDYSPMDDNHQIELNRSIISRALGTIAGFLVLASIGGLLTKFLLGHDTVYGLIDLFNLDGESNIPSYFSASLLLLAALLLSIISVLKRKSRAPYAFQWTILAFTFLYLAVDEAASIHELLSRPTVEFLGDRTIGIFYFAWVIPGMAITLVFALFFSKMFLASSSTIKIICSSCCHSLHRGRHRCGNDRRPLCRTAREWPDIQYDCNP